MSPETAALIAAGERTTTEFKSDARKPFSDSQVVEAVVCLANGSGGTLLTLTGLGARYSNFETKVTSLSEVTDGLRATSFPETSAGPYELGPT